MTKKETLLIIERDKGQYGPGVEAATHALRDGDEADETSRAMPARSGEGRSSDPSHAAISFSLSLSLFLAPAYCLRVERLS